MLGVLYGRVILILIVKSRTIHYFLQVRVFEHGLLKRRFVFFVLISTHVADDYLGRRGVLHISCVLSSGLLCCVKVLDARERSSIANHLLVIGIIPGVARVIASAPHQMIVGDGAEVVENSDLLR